MYKRFVLGELWHLIRKGIVKNIASNCVLTPVCIRLYQSCGFKNGKGCFIGMKCYLDDLCVNKIEIGNNTCTSPCVIDKKIPGSEYATESESTLFTL